MGALSLRKGPSGCSVGLWSEVRWELSAEACKGEQSWSHPTFLTGFLPWDSLLPGSAPFYVYLPRKDTLGVRGSWEGEGTSLIPTPCPVRGGSALDRGDSKAVPVPLPGPPAAEPQADPRAGGRVH